MIFTDIIRVSVVLIANMDHWPHAAVIFSTSSVCICDVLDIAING